MLPTDTGSKFDDDEFRPQDINQILVDKKNQAAID